MEFIFLPVDDDEDDNGNDNGNNDESRNWFYQDLISAYFVEDGYGNICYKLLGNSDFQSY
jgi:hypothetical protein